MMVFYIFFHQIFKYSRQALCEGRYNYTLKPYYRETRTNTTLDAYRIGTRCEGYNAILHYNLISTSLAITQQF
jgi:hypothetical protein